MNEIGTTGGALTSSNDMDIKIGYLGSILMIIGPFLPVATILGISFDYMGGGDGDGIFVLILGLVSLALIRFNQFKILAVTSVIVLLMILNFISDISTILSEPAYGAYVILVSSLLTGYASFRNW